MQKNSYVFISFFLHLKPDFSYSGFSFAKLSWGQTTNNLHLTGKISLKLISNSSLLLEFDRTV